jgi:hypothetical protein
MYNLVGIPPTTYLHQSWLYSTHDHSIKFLVPHSRTSVYRISNFPQVIRLYMQIDWMIINCFTYRSRIFYLHVHVYGQVTITGEGLKILGLCLALRAIAQGEILIVPLLLWHGASVFLVSSEGHTRVYGGPFLTRIRTDYLCWSLMVAISLDNFKAQLSRSTSTFLAADAFILFLILTVNMLLAYFTLRKILIYFSSFGTYMGNRGH